MSEVEQAKWRLAGFHPEHFALTRQHGWTYHQYRALMILESTDRITTLANLDVPYDAALEAWITSGIPADRALRYREARVPAAVALDLETRKESGEPIEQAIETLLALRHPTPRSRWHPES